MVRESVIEGGLKATLFTPSTGGPHPAIICVEGSLGGLHENRAALLASHGFATMALAYFGVEGIPAELNEIPLETVEKGIKFLEKKETIDSNRIGIWGFSKGAELALLAGATFPKFRLYRPFHLATLSGKLQARNPPRHLGPTSQNHCPSCA